MEKRKGSQHNFDDQWPVLEKIMIIITDNCTINIINECKYWV